MTAEQFEKLKAFLHKNAEGIATAKRPGYTQGNGDVLRNFKRVAEAIPNTCPDCGYHGTLNAGQALSVYFLKHVDATVSALSSPDLPQAESLEGRFSDILNYADLGFALYAEQDFERRLRAALEQMSGPDNEPPPHPEPAQQTESQPSPSPASNILPWKLKQAREEPLPLSDTPIHQSEHPSKLEEQVVVPSLPYGLRASFVEASINDAGVVDDRDWGDVNKAVRRIQVTDPEPETPVA